MVGVVTKGEQYGVWFWVGLFLALDHDDVVAKFGFDGWISKDGPVHRARLESKGGLLERANHRSSRHPSQIALAKKKEREILPAKKNHGFLLVFCSTKI